MSYCFGKAENKLVNWSRPTCVRTREVQDLSRRGPWFLRQYRQSFCADAARDDSAAYEPLHPPARICEASLSRARQVERRAVQEIVWHQFKPRPHEMSGSHPFVGTVINAVL